MALQQSNRPEGFSKGSIRALRLIVKMRQEKAGPNKEVKIPEALKNDQPNFWKESKRQF